MNSNRGLLLAACALTAVGWLEAQVVEQHPPGAAAIVLNVTVTDDRAAPIKGLKPAQFRVWEDGIPQKIATFAEGGQQSARVNEDGSSSPLDGPNAAREGVTPGIDPETGLVLDHVYTITYHPDPSNRNEGFRMIRIEIAQDVYQRLRIRTKPGYRPGQRIR